MNYRLIKNPLTTQITCVNKMLNDGSIISIPFAPDNTDYVNFKTAILEDKAQLQDAEGKQMSAEQAKQFVKELP